MFSLNFHTRKLGETTIFYAVFIERFRNLKVYFLNENSSSGRSFLRCVEKSNQNKSAITSISETRITKQVSLLDNSNLNNYSYEFTSTEISVCGTLFYTANHLSYKSCTLMCRIVGGL